MIRTMIPGRGGAKPIPFVEKAFKLIRFGCANRPFFHIVVNHKLRRTTEMYIEQVGVYDPMPNYLNERIVSLNLERIHYWMAQGVTPTKHVAELFGMAGFLPIHPRTIMTARRHRKKIELEKLNNDSEKLESPSEETK